VSLLNRVRSTISRSGLLLYLLPLALLGIFFFYPLIIILMTMFSRSGEIYSSGIWQPLGFTFYQALLSTFFTLVLGLPIAFVFARFDFTGKRLLRTLTLLPFILPTVVTAAAFNALLGPRGWINAFLLSVSGETSPPIVFLNTFTAIFGCPRFLQYRYCNQSCG